MKTILLILCLFNVNTIFCQFTLNISLESDHPVTLSIFDPYENKWYNNSLATRVVTLDTTGIHSFDFPIKEDGFIKISFDGMPFFVYAETNGVLNLHAKVFGDSAPVNLDWMKITGSNAAGIKLFNEQFVYPNFTAKFTPIWNLIEENYQSIDEVLDKFHQIVDLYVSKYNDLYNEKLISDSFRNLVLINFKAVFLREIARDISLKPLNKISYINSSSTKKVILEKLRRTLNPFDENIFKSVLAVPYTAGMIELEYFEKSEILSLEQMPDSTFLINEKVFKLSKYFVPILYASKNLQSYLLGRFMIDILNAMPTLITKDDFIVYKEIEKAENIYSAYLKEKEKNFLKNHSITINKKITFIDSSITISSLVDLTNYLGKERLYVDIWATWCIPCIQEFKNYTNIDSYLSTYNIKKVFLSIDLPQNTEQWKTTIQRHDLEGIHLLASEKLVNDIKKLYPSSEVFSIPRYLIVDESGKIMNKDAPRPSSGSKLLTDLNSWFKSF